MFTLAYNDTNYDDLIASSQGPNETVDLRDLVSIHTKADIS